MSDLTPDRLAELRRQAMRPDGCHPYGYRSLVADADLIALCDEVTRLRAECAMQEEAEEELCTEASARGFEAGFVRCLELVQWACRESGVSARRIERIARKIDAGPATERPSMAAENQRLRERLAAIEKAAGQPITEFPCRMDEMTERESAIARVACEAVGTLSFIRRFALSIPPDQGAANG